MKTKWMKVDEADSVILVLAGGKEGEAEEEEERPTLVQPVLPFHLYTGPGDQTCVLLLA